MMFYERLRSLLKDKGMTGKEFSEEMGVTTAKAGRWLTGVTEPSFDELIQICDYFKVSTDYILRGKLGEFALSEEDIKFLALSKKEKKRLMNIEKLL